MPKKRTKSIQVPMPTGGVNTDRPSTFIDPTQSPDARNTRYDYGRISPRDGTAEIGGDTLPLRIVTATSGSPSSGSFVVGEAVSQETSLATGTVLEVTSTTVLVIAVLTGTFVISEEITGAGGATVTPSSVVLSAGIVLDLPKFEGLDGVDILMAVTDEAVYSYATSPDTWGAININALTNTPLTGTISNPVSTCHFDQGAAGTIELGWYIVVSNGVDPVFVWKGTGAAIEVVPDAYADIIAKQVFTYKSSVFYLAPTYDSDTFPQQIYWSQTGTIDNLNFATTNAGFINLYDTPGHLVWSGQLGDNIALYKDDSIALLSYTAGTTLFRYDTVVRGPGLLSPGLLAVIEGEHIYISKNNVFRWAGGPSPTPIGDPIFQDFLDNINWEAVSACRSVVDKVRAHVTFFIPSGSSTYADRAYVYDYREGWWSIDEYATEVTATGIWSNVTGFAYADFEAADTYATMGVQTYEEYQASVGQDILLQGDEDGNTYQQDSASLNDNGVAINQYHVTPDFVPDGSEYQSRWFRYMGIELELKGGSVEVDYSLDGGATWVNIGTQTIAGVWAWYKQNFTISGQKIRFRFLNNSLESNFSMRAYNIKLIPRGAAT